MSKPRPFSQSLWGVALVLVATLIVLGVNNYRGHLAGFDLAYDAISVSPVTPRTQANTAVIIQSADDFAQLIKPTQPIAIHWNKQIAIAYFADTQSTTGYQLTSDNVHREGATVGIRYQLSAPQPDTKVVRTKTTPGLIVILDRSRLISSSELTINLLNGKQITHTLKLSPEKI